MADATTGAAVHTVRADDPVAKVEAADRLLSATFVTAEAVEVEPILPPYTLIVQLVLTAAHCNRFPTAYSPADSDVAAKVNGWILFPAHPCCKVEAVPDVDVPDAHDTAREALRTLASDVLFASEYMMTV